MTNIIVAFSKPEDGKNIKGILVRNGFQVVAVCTSGSLALSAAEGVGSGIVVSGYRFEDMLYDELRQYLPAAFDMLLISSPSRLEGQAPGNVICLPMPLKVHDLISTLGPIIPPSVPAVVWLFTACKPFLHRAIPNTKPLFLHNNCMEYRLKEFLQSVYHHIKIRFVLSRSALIIIP